MQSMRLGATSKGIMKRVTAILIAALLLFCACETRLPEAGGNETGPTSRAEQHAKPTQTETSALEATPEERTITTCADALTEQESAALNDFLCSTAIYRSDDAALLAAAEWSCRLNEHCLIAVAHWEYDKRWGNGEKDGFEPVLLYEEDGAIQATELGNDACGLLDPWSCGKRSDYPMNMSFIQQVGTTTLICLDSYDLTYRKSDRLFDNRFTEPLKLCYTDLYHAQQSAWVRGGTGTDDGIAFDGVNSDEYSYLFAIEDMEDNYRLYVGDETLTGAYLRSLLAGDAADE